LLGTPTSSFITFLINSFIIINTLQIEKPTLQ
jgi:hypothetical protein